MKLKLKFEVSISKNKETGQQSGYQKIWKIALFQNKLGLDFPVSFFFFCEKKLDYHYVFKYNINIWKKEFEQIH